MADNQETYIPLEGLGDAVSGLAKAHTSVMAIVIRALINSGAISESDAKREISERLDEILQSARAEEADSYSDEVELQMTEAVVRRLQDLMGWSE